MTWLSPLGESPGVTPNLGDNTSICIKGPLPREEMKIIIIIIIIINI